jgi:hypothetical protein
MQRIELESCARLILLPARAGHAAAAAVWPDGTLGDAIRHVMEALPADERQRAVIQTEGRLLFFAEIEAIFETAILPAEAVGAQSCAAHGLGRGVDRTVAVPCGPS